MKLSRRHMMGTLVGGAVAGPQAAKAAINEGMQIRPPTAYPSNYPKESIELADKLGKHIDRKKQLQDIINGKLLPWQEDQLNEYNRYNLFEANIRSLVSVSDVNKQIMVINASKKSLKERFIQEAKNELKHYLNIMG